MKKLISLSLLFAAIASSSCTEEQISVTNIDNPEYGKILLTKEELTSISFDSISEISEDEAINMASEFFKIQSNKENTKSGLDFKVKSKKYVGEKVVSTKSIDQSKDAYIPVYELVAENGDGYTNSYAIVSADERAPGVRVFFDDFPTNPTEVTEGLAAPNTKAIMNLAEYQLIKDVEKVEQAKSKLRNLTIKKICDKLNISLNDYSFNSIMDKIYVDGIPVTRNHAGTQSPTGQVILRKDPMCKILWKQSPPYNRACPEGNILISLGVVSLVQKGRVPAGCVTIACINAEACVERPIIGGIPMDWAYYKSTKTLFEASEEQTGGTPALLLERAGNAIRYIYNALGSSSLYSSYNGKSYVSATGSSSGESYIKNNFNYQNDQSFDPDVVLSSLSSSKPIYISGQIYGSSVDNPNSNRWDGHAFVIDGFIVTEKSRSRIAIQETPQTRSDIVQYYDMYWHVNLGWGGNSSAYFKLDSDATCAPEFTDDLGRYELIPMKNMRIITHLSKK